MAIIPTYPQNLALIQMNVSEKVCFTDGGWTED